MCIPTTSINYLITNLNRCSDQDHTGHALHTLTGTMQHCYTITALFIKHSDLFTTV